MSLRLLAVLPDAWAYYQTTAKGCRRIDSIYASGEELCERIFEKAFRYEANESRGFTMWFFEATNPNDATAERLGLQQRTCKEIRSDEVSECHPWRRNACCDRSAVASLQVLKNSFGAPWPPWPFQWPPHATHAMFSQASFHWDRCGPLSQACERFFVQEACFYEPWRMKS